MIWELAASSLRILSLISGSIVLWAAYGRAVTAAIAAATAKVRPRRLCTALTIEHFGCERRVFGEVDVVGGLGCLLREGFEVRQRRFQGGDVRAAHEGRESFISAPLRAVQRHEAVHGLGAPARGNLRDDAAKRHALRVRPPARHDEVLRHHARPDLANAALEADRVEAM